MSMFEPQDHPNDFAYPGGPPRPPYDSAGWTVAFQMGIQFDRILDAFDGPFEALPGKAKPAPGRVPRAIRPRPPDSSSTTASTTRPSSRTASTKPARRSSG